MKTAFYAGMIVTMFVCFVAAFFFQISVVDDNAVANNKMMAPALRQSEFEAIRRESETPITSASQYFRRLSRMDLLIKADSRADREERGETQTQARLQLMALNVFENDLVNKLPREIGFSAEFQRLGKTYSGDSGLTDRIPWHQDPRATMFWFLFYFGAMPLIAIHYGIRLRGMGCSVWLEACTHWKFPMCVAFWPIGIFKYPKEISAKEQFVRAYRFVVCVLSYSLACFTVALTARAQEKDDSPAGSHYALQISASTSTLPEYLGSNGAIFHVAPVQQSSVTLSVPPGFYFGIWNSVPLAGFDATPDYGFEIDYSAGWNGRMKWLNLNGDLTYIDVTPLGKAKGDVLQITGTASHAFSIGKRQTLSPYLTVNRVLPVSGSAPKAGVFIREGVNYSIQTTSRLSVGVNAESTWDSGAFGFDRAHIARAGLTGNWKLSGHWTLMFPIIRFSTPLSDVSDGRKTELPIGIGLTFSR